MDPDEAEKIIPGGEEAYDEVNDLISETDWATDVKVLTAETKVKMYAYFGHELKLKEDPKPNNQWIAIKKRSSNISFDYYIQKLCLKFH